MTTPRQEISHRYSGLRTSGQLNALAALADRMTLFARDTFATDAGVSDPARLRAFNEAQHRIAAQLHHLMSGREARYPDDVFANILCDQFESLGIDLDVLATVLGRCEPAETAA